MPDPVTYSAVLPVAEDTVQVVSALLAADRRRRRTRPRRRALGCYRQAVLVLRWFCDGTRLAQLAADDDIGPSTAHRFLHEGIDALAAQGPGSRRAHASRRFRVEHGISHLKNWRALSRHLGRREHLDTDLRAVAGLVFSQERAPRPDHLHRRLEALPAGTGSSSNWPWMGQYGPRLTMHEVVSRATAPAGRLAVQTLSTPRPEYGGSIVVASASSSSA